MKRTENDELTTREAIATVLKTAAVVLPAGFAWLFYGKDILRWLFAYGTTISWTVLALAAVAVVVFAAVKLAARLNPPKRYGTIPAEMIRTILK